MLPWGCGLLFLEFSENLTAGDKRGGTTKSIKGKIRQIRQISKQKELVMEIDLLMPLFELASR